MVVVPCLAKRAMVGHMIRRMILVTYLASDSQSLMAESHDEMARAVGSAKVA